MSTACLVLFHKYEPSGRGCYNFLFDYFLKHVAIWGSTIDHFYIIDSGKGIDDPRVSALKRIVNATFFHRNSASHWGNMNFAVPQIKEDKLLLIDGDTIFSRLDVVQGIVSDLDTHQIVSLMDTSGGIDLFNQFDIFKANKNRDLRRRFAPYLFACQTELFKKIGSYDFTPLSGSAWTDSMGWITKQLLDLDPTIKELPDDRSSLYYIDGKYEEAAFLDGPTFEWSKSTKNDYGYYHIRNWSGGHYLTETRILDRPSYNRAQSIMPSQEALRLLAWLAVTSDKVYEKDILAVVNDYGITADVFNDYLEAFKNFHTWSKLI